MELKGSKTQANLLAAFAGESMARNKYTFFASVAKNAGYEQIAGIFLDNADNEKEHAKRIAMFLGDVIGDTQRNLEQSSGGHLAVPEGCRRLQMQLPLSTLAVTPVPCYYGLWQ